MDYKQSVYEYNLDIGKVRLEYTYELHDHVWLLDELYIVVDGQQLLAPPHWGHLAPSRVLPKIIEVMQGQQDDYCSNEMRR